MGLQQHFGDMAGAEFKATPPLGCNLFCSHVNAEMVLNVKDRMLLKPLVDDHMGGVFLG